MIKISKIIYLSITLISISNAVIGQSLSGDSLVAKRKFLITKIYQKDVLLTKKSILALYEDNRQATIKYKWGNALKPLGLPVAIGGIALAANAIRGIDKVAIVNGKEHPYVERSLPKLLIGLGLVIGGGCLIESSNELVAHSTDRYNDKKFKKTAYFGFTNDGIGLGFKW